MVIKCILVEILGTFYTDQNSLLANNLDKHTTHYKPKQYKIELDKDTEPEIIYFFNCVNQRK